MRVRLRLWQVVVLTVASVLAGALGGCGQPSTRAAVTTPTVLPTVTLGPTATPRPTATPELVGQLCSSPGAFGPAVGAVGDLKFDATHLLDMYPALKLADGLALKPLQVDGLVKTPEAAQLPLANVRGYSLDVCNTSQTASHAVGGVTVKIAAFSAYTAQLSVTRVCSTAYARQGLAGGGCGGGRASAPLELAATLTSNTVGTVASASPTGGSSLSSVTLAPGRAIQVVVTITPPSVPGMYAYQLGLAVDGASSAYPDPATQAILQAPVAHEWDGDACLTDSMQSQIPPATTPPTYYICPKA